MAAWMENAVEICALLFGKPAVFINPLCVLYFKSKMPLKSIKKEFLNYLYTYTSS